MTNRSFDQWRVDVAGVAISVHGSHGKDHLEHVNRQLARMKMALHRIARIEDGDGCGDIAREALKDG